MEIIEEILEDKWIVTLPTDIFPILDYSKNLENTFSGHIVETEFDTYICIGKCINLVNDPVNLLQRLSPYSSTWLYKAITEINLTNDGNIQLVILK